MIPVTVLTGFLGSGKTTLLGAALRQPGFARTAVVINELGEIGLDHELIATSDAQFVALTTGCLCCKMQSDLVVTLEEMLARREAGAVMAFERIVIETSGAADPAPILHALMTTPGLAERLALAGVVATVDAVTAEATLAREALSRKQMAVADRLVITKTDLAGGVPEVLAARLEVLNPDAPRCIAVHGGDDAARLLGEAPLLLAQSPAQGDRPNARDTASAGGSAHLDGIATFTIIRESPVAAVALALVLEALAEHCGAGLLRLKGLVAVAEAPERPAVVHGVQHVFHPLEWLERWPSADRRTRLVLIARGVPRSWVEALFAAVEAEVAEAAPMR
jgi:G3E family GTPase